MAHGQRYTYSGTAAWRICLRELGQQGGFCLWFVLLMETGQFLGNHDFNGFLWKTAMMFVAGAVLAALYTWRRVPHLRSVLVQFDASELIYDVEHDRRELLASDVVSFVSTPRLIHIVSRRPRYTATSHSELDRFEELRSALAAWLPVPPAPWTPPQPPTLLRRCLGTGTGIAIYAVVERLPNRPLSWWVLLTGFLLLPGFFWY